jgi:chlorite dismutase
MNDLIDEDMMMHDFHFAHRLNARSHWFQLTAQCMIYADNFDFDSRLYFKVSEFRYFTAYPMLIHCFA